jgi:formyltetrahydrofolate-dependent phosphoribosylglycinamide formyltransferase
VNNPARPQRRQTRPIRLAVLLSGTGRTLANLLDVIAAGELNAEIVHVISSTPGVRGIEIAEAAGIPTTVIPRRDYPTAADYSAAIFSTLAPSKPDLIVLAGFLRKLIVPEEWTGRILNIHPALLPQAESYAAGKGFYGAHVHEAVLAHGDRRSGATVHVVDNGYDTGPTVLQAEVPVLPSDTPETLAARVFEVEKQLYPAAIRRYVAANPALFGDLFTED